MGLFSNGKKLIIYLTKSYKKKLLMKMNLKDKVEVNLVKELELFNRNFDQYKIDYMDKDDRSTEEDVAKELLIEVFDIFNKRKEDKMENEVNNCSICLEDISCKNNNCKLCCGHEFHLSCIFELNKSDNNYSNKCPLCRKIFNEKNGRDMEITREMIHDTSLTLGGLDMSLIHRITHLNNTQLLTLNSLIDILD